MILKRLSLLLLLSAAAPIFTLSAQTARQRFPLQQLVPIRSTRRGPANSASSQHPVHAPLITAMKLLTPTVGWAATERHLLSTVDGGEQWKDITPDSSHAGRLSSVCFLSADRGWVFLSRSGEPEPKFEVASTTDDGGSWSVVPVTVPDPDPSRGLSQQAWIDFADTNHGWATVQLNSNTAVSIGVLLSTEDGGKTWKSRKSPPVAGSIHFVTATNGWLAGGPNEELYATYDSGDTWKKVVLNAPPEVQPATYAYTYDLPVFSDAQHGRLTVHYVSSGGGTWAVVLYATSDGGRSWIVDKALPAIDEAHGGAHIISTVADSVLITAARVDSRMSMAVVGSGGKVLTSNAEVFSSASAVLKLSFLDSMHGWTSTSDALLSTSDGGASWSNITPAAFVPKQSTTLPKRSPVTAASAFIHNPAHSNSVANISPSITPSPLSISVHLGFDKSRVLGVGDMQTWWNSSPYFDTSLYLPGSPNRGTDPLLNSAWVNGVESQGWGLFPIWFGLQAPCVLGSFTTFSSDTSTAQAQGISEADAAAAAAQALGLNGTILYHDIENYDTGSVSCRAAVTAFLSGWVYEAHIDGFQAGVYGNPAPASLDFSQALPIPDDMWVARYDNRVTIWGLGALADSPWMTDQRMHQ
jgi:photosystem II stability/assembly factor-like uncharacterized protein